jgi:hypothetical protein
MGNSTSVSQREREKYTEAVVEWERVCAAMEAEEARSHARNRMGTCSLAGYCVIQTVGKKDRANYCVQLTLLLMVMKFLSQNSQYHRGMFLMSLFWGNFNCAG